MGVTYKLKEEVVGFIINERKANPLFSCRQLAESASQKFGLRLSKSSVHDVLKESGIITPRGRKPKNKFEIPQEKKLQIKDSLSQTNLLPPPPVPEAPPEPRSLAVQPIVLPVQKVPPVVVQPEKSQNIEISPEYEGAGRVFLKAALWDLGIFSDENIKETDWLYYLTYCKGIKIALEGDRDVIVEMPLPIERCIQWAVDGLINNVRPLFLSQVSDQELFKACMEARPGFKIMSVSVVDGKDHKILEICDIVEFIRKFSFKNICFVENFAKTATERAKGLFFPQSIEIKELIENIFDLKGFDSISDTENVVKIIVPIDYDKIQALNEAADKLNSMYLFDEHNKQVKVEIIIG
ncbi:MAG: helix-turn-helix domain-containing protein [Candidatus Omnitrophica bacterium]|nr:helix-turn-helix domain-containing protein [Candidatus Omnitrophota bacterium]